MADTEIELTTDTEPSALLKDDTHESQNEDAGRKGTIARIAEILRGKRSPVVEQEATADETEEVEPVTDTEPSEPEGIEDESVQEDEPEVFEAVDTRFVDAARRYGWSDDRIVAYAEVHDDHDLVMLTGMMEGQARPVTKDDVTEVPVKEESPYAGILKELEANDAIGGATKNLLTSLVKDLEITKSQLRSVTDGQAVDVRSRQQNEWLGKLRTADEVFDGVSKEFPEIGATKALKRLPDGSLNPSDPAVQVREQLFKIAASLHTTGTSWDSSIKDALRWYRGGREDAVEAKVLKRIKDNAKRISPRREARHQTKKFTSEIEEKAAVVNEALRKHGVELAE
jgi:hypothetical protein